VIIGYVVASGDREFCAPALTRELSPMSHIAVSDAGASEPPAPDYCDPKITGAVEEAFEAVWAVIKANDQAGIEIETDCERRAELSRSLRSWSWKGITDVAELRGRALASFGLAEARQE
jgi:hypothetical protein